MDCLFCSIAAGEAESDLVAETDRAVAFRDINPQAPIHVLVIPRHHVADSLQELRPDEVEVLGEMIELAQQVALDHGLERGWRLVANVGEEGGQTVPHLHLHVLGGRRMGWPPG